MWRKKTDKGGIECILKVKSRDINKWKRVNPNRESFGNFVELDLMTFFRTILLIAVLSFAAGGIAGAQRASDDIAAEPSLAYIHPVYGSDLVLYLHGAPSDSSVTYYRSRPGTAPVEIGSGFTDSEGGHVLTLPLTNPDWVGEEITLWASIRLYGGGEIVSQRRTVRVSNPSFFFPLATPDGTGSIACYDELDTAFSDGVEVTDGRPGRVLFSRDGSRGFVILDTDQIGVFDPVEREWLYWFLKTGVGVLDMEATPDGKSIIVLCSEKHPGDADTLVRGSLWVFDIDSGAITQRAPVKIDALNPAVPHVPAAAGRLLAVSNDSRLVFIRIGGPFIGEYNLDTGAFRRTILGNGRLSPCTVNDIRVRENCLAALLTEPDGYGWLCLSNTQTYLQDYLSVGWEPEAFEFFEGDSGPRVLVLHRSEDSRTDVIDVYDLFNETLAGTVARLPAGVRDVAVNDTRDLGVILYVPGGANAREGWLGFFEKRTFRLRNEVVKVPVDSGSSVFLSRSPIVNRCYVLTRSGTLCVVDLETFSKVDLFDLNAESSAVPAESF